MTALWLGAAYLVSADPGASSRDIATRLRVSVDTGPLFVREITSSTDLLRRS